MTAEVMAVVCVVLLLLLPVVLRIRNARFRVMLIGVVVVGGTASAVGVWFADRPQQPPARSATSIDPGVTEKGVTDKVPFSDNDHHPALKRDEEIAKDRPIEVHGEGYVGSKSCLECHQEQYDTWQATYHRTMTQVATPETVLGDFYDVDLKLFGKTYRLTRRGDEFWAEFPDPDWSGPEHQRPRIQRQIVQTTGSHHMQVYWYPTGHSRFIGMFPFVYLKESRRWIPRQAAFLGPPEDRVTSESMRWNLACIKCHTTGAQPRIRMDLLKVHGKSRYQIKSADVHVAEFGISCEACHGPAEEHINSDLDTDDLKIVEPTRLPSRLSSQVCGQCHGVSDFYTNEDMRHWAVHGFFYRPGADLSKTRFVYNPKENLDATMFQELLQVRPHFLKYHFWSDGMIRLAGREYNGLIDSPCYKHGDQSQMLSCFSCHLLHKPEDDRRPFSEWTNDLLKPGMRTNQACIQCHEQFKDNHKLVTHTHHPPDSSGSRCYNCHMSYTTYGLLTAIRSHTIDSPTVQSSLQTGRPNACNQCHLDKTLAWAAEQLEEWYDIGQPELSEDEQTIAASVLWTLKGDAGQRALMAWSMGWPVARQTSGTDWMTPYLAELMTDSYDAVRFIAHRSLRRDPQFHQVPYDFIAPRDERKRAAKQVFEKWSRAAAQRKGPRNDRLLMTREGTLQVQQYKRLLKQRDNRPVLLSE